MKSEEIVARIRNFCENATSDVSAKTYDNEMIRQARYRACIRGAVYSLDLVPAIEREMRGRQEVLKARKELLADIGLKPAY